MNKETLFTKYPITAYFVATYLITWGGIVLIAMPKLQAGSPLAFEDIGLMFLLMLLGPSAMGFFMNGMVDGREGIKNLFRRILKLKNSPSAYALAVLTTPIILLLVLFSLNYLVSPDYFPVFQILGIVLGFMAGFFEEIGWTGFALPALLKKFPPVKAGLILGLLWGFWHFLADFLGAYETLGTSWLPIFLFRYIVALTAYRLLMVQVYNRTKSVFICQVMHGMFSGTLYMFGPTASNGVAVVWNGVFALTLWVFVGIVLTRKSPRPFLPAS